MAFPFYQQPDAMDCGPTCLRMIAKFYGKTISLSDLRQASQITREGSSLLGLSEAAEKMGFRTMGVKATYEQLLNEVPLPCIAFWNQIHYVVIHKIKKNKVYVADPGHGLLVYNKEDFLKSWISDGEKQADGVLLLFETTPEFYEEDTNEFKPEKPRDLRFLAQYLFKHKKLLVQLMIGLFAGSLLQLIFPFLTQSIVDIGIQTHDVHFIHLVLLAQLMVFFGRISIDIMRSWILLHISSRINIALVSDFFVKLMKLPISFFDTKMTSDIMQRIEDHYRIEKFLTGSSMIVFFSLINLSVFSFILAWYNVFLFVVFTLCSVLYVIWILFFLKRRADLDFKNFNQNVQNQSKVIELINGMQEIKLHNAERQKRWQWENLQVKKFRIGIQGLTITQWQNSGSGLINELKNIFISFLSAKLVLDGQITLGMMLSISYIIGQMNMPILELVDFLQQWQDAKLSLARLSEIHNKEIEEPTHKEVINELDLNADIVIKNLSFCYQGINRDLVLNNLSLTIPANKITAIVGASGSGKTTLIKLLLKFYEPVSGEIKVGQANLKQISAKLWRDKCGVVMQEGFIFSESIAHNIAFGEETIDKQRLRHAVTVANIKDFIEQLPLGYNTKVGMEGIGLSTGQKQRLLIARAVYKNPEYLFFDEATSALDANNEKSIINNLNEFFVNKTVVVIAHRLSTVKGADQIVVLDNGNIVEIGNHQELTEKRGAYFELVKNQLELGN